MQLNNETSLLKLRVLNTAKVAYLSQTSICYLIIRVKYRQVG